MEHINQIVAWELLFIFVFASLFVVTSVEEGGLRVVTGHAIEGVTEETVLDDLERVLPTLPFVQDVDTVDVCLVVNVDATTRYNYEILKVASTLAITPSDNFMCQGQTGHDFIFSYISYAALQEHLTNVPAFSEFKRTSDGTNLYVLPSREILPGGSLADVTQFNAKYEDLFRKHLTKKEADRILKPQLRVPGAAEESFFLSYLFFFIVGIVVLVIILGSFLIMKSKKPEVKEDLELVSFIKSAVAQGYTNEQIRQSLIDNGWKPENIDEAFKTVNSGVTMPQTFA